MIWLKRGAIVVAALLVLAVLGFNLFKAQIAERAFEAAVDRNAGVDPSA